MNGAQLLPERATSAPFRSVSTPKSVRDAQLDPKLIAAAHQFEASLMQELLKPLDLTQPFGENQDGDAEVGGLTSSAEGSGSALMSFGSEALAKGLSEKGGLGIARKILDHFEERKP
ncbi:hypothetical protein ACPOL_1066 [Acidisarcina polymorpha]|uniref:Flagellar protein FlgJ N-terminal domain-containing protein n=1 Tax=Acidisarcina polymorpha TaxID=2211140 RepID=A0A2Z5FV82_9BACT|nr:hypothetical protein [Acidisarcina polymorpha]AXC10417.1 hypothetical protein ACPOL_1066 [Acidisarcina polymorpha]